MSIINTEILLKAVECSPASIIITDKNGVVEFVNNKFIEVSGYSKKEVLGQKPSILKSGLQTNEFYKQLWETISLGKEWKGEFHNKRKDGTFYWESASISSFKDDEGNILKYVAVKEDITNKKELEKVLKMKEFSIENTKEGMMWLSLNGDITYCNISYHEMLGYGEGEINKKKSWYELVPKEYRSLWKEYFNILKKKKNITLEHFHLTKNSENFPMEASLNYFKIDDEEYVFVFTRDTTIRREMENIIKLSEDKFTKIFMFIPDSVLVTDLETSEYLEVNNSFEKNTGWNRSECIGKTIYELNIWKHPEKRDEMIKILKKNNGEYYNYEVEFILKNGEEKTGLMAGKIINYDGKDRLLTIIRDISDRKQYIIDLEQAKEKAEKADKLKSAFLANLSHEIRTPMNAIVGFSDLLKDDNITIKEKAEYIQIVNESGDELLKLIDDIIDIAKIEADELKIEEIEFYIDNIMVDLYTTYKNKIKFNNKNINLICESCSKTKKLLAYIDPYRVKQVLSNLISNAIKFTEEGYIEYGFLINGDKLEFFVKDTGIGIDKKYKDLIFERFRQIDESKTRKYGGTGLGLNICLNLVKMMGGDIWLESKSKEGTIFYFTVPFNPVIDYKQLDDPIFDINDYDWRGKKILIVEDMQTNYEYLYEIIKNTGCDLIHAENGKLALEYFVKYNPDIILMDIQMPIMNGIEAKERIRDLNPNAIIIAQTAYAMKNDKVDCLNMGFNGYVSKPINKIELFDLINKLLKINI
jgi:signal transduction histidine kinase/CheY-like chemotaxis protein